MGFVPAEQFGDEDDLSAYESQEPDRLSDEEREFTLNQRDRAIVDLIADYENQREEWLEKRYNIRNQREARKTRALDEALATADKHLHALSSDIAMLKNIRYAKNPDGTPLPIPWDQPKHVSAVDVSQPKPLRKGGESLSPKLVRSHVPLGVKQDISVGEMESAGKNPIAEVPGTFLEQRASIPSSDQDDEVDRAFERLEQPGESLESTLDANTIYAELAQKLHVEMNAVTRRLRKDGLSKEECKVHPDYLIAYGAWRELYDHNLAVSRRQSEEQERQIAAASAMEDQAPEETIVPHPEPTGPELVWDMPTEPETGREESDLVLPGWDGTIVPTSVPAVHAEKKTAPRTFFPAGIPDTILRQAIEDLEQTVAFLDEQVRKHRHDRALHFSFLKERKKVLDMLKQKRSELRDLERGEAYGPSGTSREQLVALRNRSAAEQLERIGYVPRAAASEPATLLHFPPTKPPLTKSLPARERKLFAGRFRHMIAASLAGALALGTVAAWAAKVRSGTNESTSIAASVPPTDPQKPADIQLTEVAAEETPMIVEESVEPRETFSEVSLPRTASTALPDFKTISEYEIAVNAAKSKRAEEAMRVAAAKKETIVRPQVEMVSAGKLISPLDTDQLMLQRGIIKYGHKGADLMPGNRSATAKIRAVADATVTAIFGGRKARDSNPDARSGDGCGNGIELTDSEGNQDTYCHLARVPNQRVGSTVVAGEKVGEMGQSGNAEGIHLHWKRVDRNGKVVNPLSQLDPSIRIVNRKNQQVFPLDGTQVAHDHRGRLVFSESDLVSMRAQTSERIARAISPAKTPAVTVTSSVEQTIAPTAPHSVYIIGPTTLVDIAQVIAAGKSEHERALYVDQLLAMNPDVVSRSAEIRNTRIVLSTTQRPEVQRIAQFTENSRHSGM